MAAYAGKVYLEGQNVMRLGDEEFRQQIRWARMSIVPQAAMNALNPVLKVGEQVAEPLILHTGMKKEKALEEARNMFQHVGVPVDFSNRYAFELSGGMRQRVAIAMALVTAPILIILDEPTSALDVLTQANIFNVLKRVKQDFEISFILITHDLSTVRYFSERIFVMYAGQLIEKASDESIIYNPLHPYTQALLDAISDPDASNAHTFREVPPGEPPSLIKPPPACRFHPRCPEFMAGLCEIKVPPEFNPEPEHRVACWLYE